jgi:predicted regulator of Ras-like GTPase activity (Roadblock/LC7/MglB family)
VTTIRAVERWIEEPLRLFVLDARVELALLLHTNGQVLAQSGFTRAMDVMSACALAAAINASASELGRQLEGKPFRGLHHAGQKRQIYLAEVATQRTPFLFLAVFDQESSLGLVQLYFEEFRKRLVEATPEPEDTGPVLAENFEGDLNKNLAVLFGRV